jgi:hypothetical protein
LLVSSPSLHIFSQLEHSEWKFLISDGLPHSVSTIMILFIRKISPQKLPYKQRTTSQVGGNCRRHYQNENQKYKLVQSYIFPCALLFHCKVEKKMILKRRKVWR